MDTQPFDIEKFLRSSSFKSKAKAIAVSFEASGIDSLVKLNNAPVTVGLQVARCDIYAVIRAIYDGETSNTEIEAEPKPTIEKSAKKKPSNKE